MLRTKRKRGRAAVADAAGSISTYGKRLVDDEKMRQRVLAAVTAGAAARRRAARQTGLTGAVRRIASDRVLRGQVTEAVNQLQKAAKLKQRKESHKGRNTLLFLAGASMVVIAVPSMRRRMFGLIGGDGGADEFDFDGTPPPDAPQPD